MRSGQVTAPDCFARADLKAVAREKNIHGANEVIAEVLAQVARWPEFAAAGMSDE